MCAKTRHIREIFFGMSGKFFVCLRKVRDIRDKFLGMSGNFFVCLRKLRYIKEIFLVCPGKKFWRPHFPPSARQKFWGEILISDSGAN